MKNWFLLFVIATLISCSESSISNESKVINYFESYCDSLNINYDELQIDSIVKYNTQDYKNEALFYLDSISYLSKKIALLDSLWYKENYIESEEDIVNRARFAAANMRLKAIGLRDDCSLDDATERCNSISNKGDVIIYEYYPIYKDLEDDLYYRYLVCTNEDHTLFYVRVNNNLEEDKHKSPLVSQILLCEDVISSVSDFKDKYIDYYKEQIEAFDNMLVIISPYLNDREKEALK